METLSGVTVKSLFGKRTVPVADKPVAIANGLRGCTVIQSADGAVLGQWSVLKPLGGDVVIAASVGNVLLAAGGDGLAGMTISNGDSVFGYFTSVTVTSGVLLAYG